MTTARARQINRQWRLSAWPEASLATTCFAMAQAAVAAPGEGEVLLRVLMVSIDPGLRHYINRTGTRNTLEWAAWEDDYSIRIGDVMVGFGVGEVISSCSATLAPGDVVTGKFGWQEFVTLPAEEIHRQQPGQRPEEMLGVLGMTGLTAYYGMGELAAPGNGATALISSAAGAVGSIAAQIARIRGYRVIGIVGGSAKVDWLKKALPFDAVLDRHDPSLMARIHEACPAGIALFFDNAGGPVLAAAVQFMAPAGRVLVCGSTSLYDGHANRFDESGFWLNVINRELQVTGFNVEQFLAGAGNRDRAISDLSAWLRRGELKSLVDLREGFETLPAALIAVLGGENHGKMLVQIAPASRAANVHIPAR